MQGRRFSPLIAILLVGVAPAGLPAGMSPVLPEINKHLQEGRSDVSSNTFALARAHAQMVLVGSDVPVSVVFQNVPKSMKSKYLSILDSGMDEWNRLLNNDIHFVRAADSIKSDVQVRFRPSVTMGGEQVAGYVNWKRTIDTTSLAVRCRFTADLQIRVKDLEGGNMPPAAMRHAVMHELGHVLGLDDSFRQGDVMGPLDIQSPVDSPTPTEVQTVQNLRTAAERILSDTESTH